MRYPNKSAGFELVLSALAVGGLALVVTWGASLMTRPDAFSDLKTVYSSAWCLAHGLDAYSISNIQGVFIHQGIAQPDQWFGHYPVYPPTTLALIAPLCIVPMASAIYFLILASVAAFVVAVTGLLQQFETVGEMPWIWKAALVTLCASGPLLGFALVVGNLSVIATAFAILSFLMRHARQHWISAVLLALAILLKPHLGVWFAVGMLLLSEQLSRRIALRAAALVVAFGTVLAVAMRGSLVMQLKSFFSTLQLETSFGHSMSISSREVLPVEAQITSLQSLLGFWSTNDRLTWASTLVVLGVAAWWLVRATRNAHTEEGATLAMGAWIAFGLLATYHRAHDAIALLLLLPWLLKQVRQSPWDWEAWIIVGCYLTMSFGPPLNAMAHTVAHSGQHSISAFLLLRQVSIAGLALLLSICVALRRELQLHNPYTRSLNSSFDAVNSGTSHHGSYHAAKDPRADSLKYVFTKLRSKVGI